MSDDDDYQKGWDEGYEAAKADMADGLAEALDLIDIDRKSACALLDRILWEYTGRYLTEIAPRMRRE